MTLTYHAPVKSATTMQVSIAGIDERAQKILEALLLGMIAGGAVKSVKVTK